MSINQTKVRPLAWIKRRLVRKGRRPYKIPVGLFKGLALNLDLQHQTQVYLGLWERETYGYLRRAAEECEWMVDIGAGHGELCLFFLKRSGARRVIAFEPQEPETGFIKGEPFAERRREKPGHHHLGEVRRYAQLQRTHVAGCPAPGEGRPRIH